MLNGLDPIIIFQFKKLAPILGDTVGKIPIISQFPDLIAMPPVPIYLAPQLTGIHIDTEEKNVDIRTDVDTKTNGEAPDVDQKGIGSVIAITMKAKKDSIGITLLSAMIDQIFNKVTSKEYSITYLHGAITIFQGVLHSFAVSQDATTDMISMRIEISKGDVQPTKADPLPRVEGFEGAQPIG